LIEKQLTKQTEDAIAVWVAKFPKEQKRSAILMALRLAQKQAGWLSDALLDEVAKLLDLPPIWIYEVAGFYSMYDRKPVGKHKIGICNSISCGLCGSAQLMHDLSKRLGIQVGQTTADGQITLQELECLGACCDGPAVMLNETEYLAKPTTNQILERIKALDGETAT
jgi:NADH-quinone oxidoreductase subunit E